VTLLDRAIARTLPVVPKTIVRRVANRYIAGETTDEALQVVRDLNSRGFRATLDILHGLPDGADFAALLTGAFFIERIFAWPGMGYAVVNAISTRDYPLVVGGVIIGSIMVTVGSLIADLLYAWADPRLRGH